MVGLDLPPLIMPEELRPRDSQPPSASGRASRSAIKPPPARRAANALRREIVVTRARPCLSNPARPNCLAAEVVLWRSIGPDSTPEVAERGRSGTTTAKMDSIGKGALE